MGRALHIERRYIALFLDFETTTLELPSKTNAGVTPRGVVYTLRSVQEVRVTSMHTLRVSIYANVGVSLSVYWQGCGRPRNRTGRCKHPRFLYVVVN